MKKIIAAVAAAGMVLSAGIVCAKDSKPDGKKLFEAHCAVCHKDGGNLIKPKDTLKKANLAKIGVKKPADIVKIMRNPEPGMTKFDEKTIPNKDATAIAEYVLKTF